MATDVERHATATSLWRGFRHWRRSRPFWGALLAILGGLEILLTEIAPLRVVVHIGLQGVIGYAVPILMVLCGLMLWFAPHPRVFYASLILLCALGSFITTNLGGFILGMLLGIVGGAMALNWTDQPRPAQPSEDPQ